MVSCGGGGGSGWITYLSGICSRDGWGGGCHDDELWCWGCSARGPALDTHTTCSTLQHATLYWHGGLSGTAGTLTSQLLGYGTRGSFVDVREYSVAARPKSTGHSWKQTIRNFDKTWQIRRRKKNAVTVAQKCICIFKVIVSSIQLYHNTWCVPTIPLRYNYCTGYSA